MKQWEVKMKCVVTKTVTCECESEEEVRSNTWDYAVDEMETGMEDWEILSVKEDK